MAGMASVGADKGAYAPAGWKEGKAVTVLSIEPLRAIRAGLQPADGQTVVEVALILTFIALVAIAALGALGTSVATWMAPILTGF